MSSNLFCIPFLLTVWMCLPLFHGYIYNLIIHLVVCIEYCRHYLFMSHYHKNQHSFSVDSCKPAPPTWPYWRSTCQARPSWGTECFISNASLLLLIIVCTQNRGRWWVIAIERYENKRRHQQRAEGLKFAVLFYFSSFILAHRSAPLVLYRYAGISIIRWGNVSISRSMNSFDALRKVKWALWIIDWK